MKFPVSPERIAALLHCPAKNVAANWPVVEECLESLGMTSPAVKIAALATIAVETARTFAPIHEYGTRDYLIRKYDGRKDLGNAHPGDGFTYSGRGFIQITGEINYEKFGHLLGIDMIHNPDAALDVNCAAAILAAYFHERHIEVAADAGNWTRVRKLVNGGTNGLFEFLEYVDALAHERSVTA